MAAGVLFVLTHIPQQRVPFELEVFSLDKVLHVLAYGLLTFLALKSLQAPGPLICVALVLILSLFGGLDEYTQTFVGRRGSLMDWLADLVGITLVLILHLGHQAGLLKT